MILVELLDKRTMESGREFEIAPEYRWTMHGTLLNHPFRIPQVEGYWSAYKSLPEMTYDEAAEKYEFVVVQAVAVPRKRRRGAK